MKFTIQMAIEDEYGETKIEEIIELNKPVDSPCDIGLSIKESKSVLKSLQKVVVCQQAGSYIKTHAACPCCHNKQRIKGHRSHQYRTLFGIISIPSLRVYCCDCEESSTKTVDILMHWLPDHNSPELQYIETKWASLMSYGLTADLLKDVLPVGEALNAATVRNHLHKVAERQEKELEGKPEYLTGCPYEWGVQPKPGKPMVVGIDGGYVRNWHEKNTNFEIIAGKSYSKEVAAKHFGFVQKIDKHPRRRLMNVLSTQGMQANQQITFLSDGAENLRNLQLNMYPESLHVLDWFHVTMRLTVLNQFAAGLVKSDPEVGTQVKDYLESAKWTLWHGNVERSLVKIDNCSALCDDHELHYGKRKQFYNHLIDMITYIDNNQGMIPNYGELYRYDETISTAFVESTINQVIAKRMVKKQQMQWDHKGAHYLLQTRIAVLDGDLKNTFKRWYPSLKIEDSTRQTKENPIALAA